MRMRQRVVLECWGGRLEAVANADENRKKEAEEQKEKGAAGGADEAGAHEACGPE